jgi:hypothetical protein
MWLRSSTACRESGVNHGYSRLAGGQAIDRSSELRPPRDADARWLAAMRAGMGRARRRSPGGLHGENSLKAKNTRRDARVALSIIDFTNPYEEVQIRGRVVERRPDSDLKVMDPISHKYTGKPFPFRSPEGRVALMIEIEKALYTKVPFEHTPGQK